MNTRFDGATKGPLAVEYSNNPTNFMSRRLKTTEGALEYPANNIEKREDALLYAAAPAMLEELIKCREAFTSIAQASTDGHIGMSAVERLAAIDKLLGIEIEEASK